MFPLAKVNSNTDFGVDFAIELLQDEMSRLNREGLSHCPAARHLSLDKSTRRVPFKQVPRAILFVKYTYCTRQYIPPKKNPISTFPLQKLKERKQPKTHQK